MASSGEEQAAAASATVAAAGSGVAPAAAAPSAGAAATLTPPVTASSAATGTAAPAANSAAAQSPTSAVNDTTTNTSVVAPAAANDDEYHEEEVVEGNWQTPQVVLHEVQTKSGEEEEEVFWKHRAKLYRWAPDISDKEVFIWKERGLGEARLLLHKSTGKVRFLLRQEKTLKIVANHYVVRTHGLCEVTPNSGSDKIWVWSAKDFADEELKLEQFALKFGTVEQANIFKAKFEEAGDVNVKAFDTGKQDTTS